MTFEIRCCRRAALRRTLTGLVALAAGARAFGQAFPNKPVRIVVPYAAGGSVDLIARIMAVRMSEVLGQPVVVDNRAGGGAVIGTNFAAKSAADGYTLLMTANPHTVQPSLTRNLPFDPAKDFLPLTLSGTTPIFVVVNASVPATTLKELIAVLKAKPDRYSYGTSGTAGPQHLAGEMFKTETGTRILHVPFKGAAPAATALVAGDVQIAFASPANVMEHVKSGRLRALAVMTGKRSRFAPDVPTMAESGFPSFDFSAWLGLFVPTGTPRDVVARLHGAAVASLNASDTREKLALQGIDAASSSVEQFSEFIRNDFERSARIVREAGVTAE